MDGFNYIDIALLILIILLGIKGILNGLVKEFFGLVGVVGGVWAASLYGNTLGHWISNNIYDLSNDSLISLIGFIVTLATVWIFMLAISELVSKLVGASALGAIDRFLGVLFAMMKVFLVLSIILYAFSNISFIRKPLDSYAEGSRLYPIMLRAGGYIVRIDSVQQITRDAGAKLNEVNQAITP